MAKSKVEVSYDLSSEEDCEKGEESSDIPSEHEGKDNSDGSGVDNGSESGDNANTKGSDEENRESDEQVDGDDENDEEDATEQKSGWADVMAKILRKQTPANKPVIMSKALTDDQLRSKRKIKEKESDSVLASKHQKVESSSDEDEGTATELSARKRAWEELGRRRVDITQRESERIHKQTATKGVLLLFNAVAKQQRIIEDRLRMVGSSERRKDNVMKSMTKGAFLDMLKATPNIVDEPVEQKPLKKFVKKKPSREDSNSDSSDDEPEGKASWSILRDDFMMGAKMKDWDKESDGESEERENGDGADTSEDNS